MLRLVFNVAVCCALAVHVAATCTVSPNELRIKYFGNPNRLTVAVDSDLPGNVRVLHSNELADDQFEVYVATPAVPATSLVRLCSLLDASTMTLRVATTMLQMTASEVDPSSTGSAAAPSSTGPDPSFSAASLASKASWWLVLALFSAASGRKGVLFALPLVLLLTGQGALAPDPGSFWMTITVPNSAFVRDIQAPSHIIVGGVPAQRESQGLLPRHRVLMRVCAVAQRL